MSGEERSGSPGALADHVPLLKLHVQVQTDHVPPLKLHVQVHTDHVPLLKLYIQVHILHVTYRSYNPS